MNDLQSMTGGESVIYKPENPWARISEIAAKAGVSPMRTGYPITICATGADGKQYDVWEVLSAVLDKLNASTR